MKRYACLFPAVTSRLVCYLLCVALVFSSVPFTASSKNSNSNAAIVQGEPHIAGTNVKPVSSRTRHDKEPKAENHTESTQCSRRDQECRQRKERVGNKDENKIGSNLPTITNSADPLYASLGAWQPPVFSWDKTPASWLEHTGFSYKKNRKSAANVQ